jgi:hypothetical protein
MSPTSYRAAPPRKDSVARAVSTVKPDWGSRASAPRCYDASALPVAAPDMHLDALWSLRKSPVCEKAGYGVKKYAPMQPALNLGE